MKRLTLFLFALFTCLMTGGWLSAWAQSPVTDLNQLSNSKVYNIKSVRGFLLYSTNYTGNLAGSAGSGVKTLVKQVQLPKHNSLPFLQ